MKDGEVVNHRSLLKVVLNPVFRYFGFCLGSIINKDETIGKYKLIKCDRKSIKWSNDCNEHDYIIKKRMIV